MATAINEVTTRAVDVVLQLAGMAGVADHPEVFAGLSFDRHSLRKRRRVPYDEFCLLAERLEALAGGPERVDELVLASYHRAVPRRFQTLMRATVSPRAILRFIVGFMMPLNYPCLDTGFDELPGGRVRVWQIAPPTARGSLTNMRATLAAFRNIPCYLGLPPAQAECEELTGHRVVMVLTLPDSHALGARLRRASTARISDALRYLAGFSEPAAPRQPASDDLHQRLAEVGERLHLTERQRAVLEHAVRGLSNKEIAARLACGESTVEFHMTQLFKRTGETSRSALVAWFWRDGR